MFFATTNCIQNIFCNTTGQSLIRRAAAFGGLGTVSPLLLAPVLFILLDPSD